MPTEHCLYKKLRCNIYASITKKDHTYENNIKIFVHDNVKSVLVYKLNHFVTQSSLQDAL